MAKSKKQIFYPCSANSNVALRNRCLLLVEKKLFTGKYKDDPWKYIRDVNRVLYAIQNGLRSSRSMTVQTAKEVNSLSCSPSGRNLLVVPANILDPDGHLHV